MPFHFVRPTDEHLRAFLARQAQLGFSYAAVGATRGPKTRSEEDAHDDPHGFEAPSGYVLDRYRTVLGEGEAVWRAARTALEAWSMFATERTEIVPPDAPIAVGTTVGVLVRSAGLWASSAARIVYVIDEPRRFGFAYGTLPGHVESGEERFTLTRTEENLTAYEIAAFSRPAAFLARVAAPWTRHEQRRFAHASLAAMRAAVISTARVP